MLYLVEGRLGVHNYMGTSTFKDVTHLVEADSVDEAMEKFNSTLSKSDPYCCDIVATANSASAVIQ